MGAGKRHAQGTRPAISGGPVIGIGATSGSGRHRWASTRSPGRRPRRGLTIALAGAAVTTTFGLLAGPALADVASESPETSQVAREAHAEALVPGTPCSVSARACVDLESQQAWLIRGGQVTRGPMTISSGGEGRATPVGHSFRVYRKDKDHVSGESRTAEGRPAPMPFSTFFADGGIAFHGGDPSRSSAGCIRMKAADAEAVFDDLQNGDKVQVVNGSQERAARGEAS